MQKLNAKKLLDKFKAGKCSDEELAWLETWYIGWNAENKISFSETEIADHGAQMWIKIDKWQHRPSKSLLFRRVAAVAAVLMLLMSGIYFYTYTYSVSEGSDKAAHDIPPGGNGATLTLSNGQKIIIKDVLAGNIAKQAGVKISKTANGQIVYEVLNGNSGAVEYNTLSSARGEQAQLRLPDGSIVFLNAASSLKYPTSFAKLKKRMVFLTGEGYFEIAKDKTHPFIVTTTNQQVEVLGTHFNINSYADEKSVKTTLIEGSVKLTAGRWSTLLKPGQQAEFSNTGIAVKEVEAADAIAWKEGYFMFNNETLESMMPRIAKWYDVDFIFEDQEAKKYVFFGTISRYEKISKVLHMLSRTDLVTFKIEGNMIKISKKN